MDSLYACFHLSFNVLGVVRTVKYSLLAQSPCAGATLLSDAASTNPRVALNRMHAPPDNFEVVNCTRKSVFVYSYQRLIYSTQLPRLYVCNEWHLSLFQNPRLYLFMVNP